MEEAAMQVNVEAFFDPATLTYSYVVIDPRSQCCAIIDSVLDYDPASGRTSLASALDSLEAVVERLKTANIQLHLSEVKGPVMDQLRRSSFLQHFGGQVFISQFQALKTLAPQLTQQTLLPSNLRAVPQPHA
jgi:hypothetical protein